MVGLNRSLTKSSRSCGTRRCALCRDLSAPEQGPYVRAADGRKLGSVVPLALPLPPGVTGGGIMNLRSSSLPPATEYGVEIDDLRVE